MDPTPPAESIQEAIPNNHCWGCGTLNPVGLHIHSHFEGDESVCVHVPGAEFMAGPTHVLNGGILATLVDCHCVCTAIADAYRSEGRAVGEPPEIWYATASLHLDYRHPTPLGGPVTLRAIITGRSSRKRTLRCRVDAGGTTTVEATVVAVRVPPEWRDPNGHALPRNGHGAGPDPRGPS